jgi:hypothetical protein
VDRAEIYKDREYIIYSWSSGVVSLPAPDCKLLLCIVAASDVKDPARSHVIYSTLAEYIGWSVENLNEGRFPRVGFRDAALGDAAVARQGEEVVPGYTCTFFALKGDAKSRVEQHRFGRYYGAAFICDRCFAVAPYRKARDMVNFMFGDSGPAAAWRGSLCSDRSYVLSGGQSYWLVVPGFALSRACRDLMHDFHQGCGSGLRCSPAALCSSASGVNVPGIHCGPLCLQSVRLCHISPIFARLMSPHSSSHNTPGAFCPEIMS